MWSMSGAKVSKVCTVTLHWLHFTAPEVAAGCQHTGSLQGFNLILILGKVDMKTMKTRSLCTEHENQVTFNGEQRHVVMYVFDDVALK